MMAQHVRRNGTFFHVEWRAAGFEYQGKHCALVIFVMSANVCMAEHRLQQRVEVRAHEQAALLKSPRVWHPTGAATGIDPWSSLGC